MPPIEYETDRALIGTAFDAPLCASDLVFIDAHIELVESLLAVPPDDDRLEVYLYDDPESLPCDQPAFGCYRRTDKIVAAVWDAIDHELTHAVTHPVPFPSAFWTEGTALVFETEGTHRHPAVLEVGDLDGTDPRRTPHAGHFQRFIIETHGLSALRSAIRGEAIEDVVGMSRDELVAQYEAEAPYAYPPWIPCAHPELPQVDEGMWSEELTFSCDSDEATQVEWKGASVVRQLSLEAGTYEVVVDGGEGVLMVGCQTEVLEEPPPDFSNGDLMNQAELEQTAFGTFFDADQAHQLELTAGVYRLALSSGTNDVATLQVNVRKL